MTLSGATPGTSTATGGWTLVWIDSRHAKVLTWENEAAVIRRFGSDVPAHRASTGHVRHDAMMRHGGGGGQEQTAGDPRRIEHLVRFTEKVADAISETTDVQILGPEEMRDRLERHLRESDRHHGRERQIVVEPAMELTDRQLTARLRELVGKQAVRGTVGAWRWTGEQPHRVSGVAKPPRRAGEKWKPAEEEAAREAALDEVAEASEGTEAPEA